MQKIIVQPEILISKRKNYQMRVHKEIVLIYEKAKYTVDFILNEMNNEKWDILEAKSYFDELDIKTLFAFYNNYEILNFRNTNQWTTNEKQGMAEILGLLTSELNKDIKKTKIIDMTDIFEIKKVKIYLTDHKTFRNQVFIEDIPKVL